MIKINETSIPGCFELLPNVFKDDRGIFIKTFHEEMFADSGLNIRYAEEYYSCSFHGVLRGLHFQTPPFDHFKLVYCTKGEVMDVVVDLRTGSPTFGKFETFIVNSEKGNMIQIPPGLAHGFLVLSDFAIMMYKVSTVYAKESDTGILWNSLEIPWPEKKPIISTRDSNFLPFSEFKSSFIFKGN
jgi:dTDP-4-dehydrorhamnose 3,5-epimerase